MFFFQAEDGIRYLVRSRGLGDVYKRQIGGGSNVGVESGIAVEPGVGVDFAKFELSDILDSVSYTHLTLPTSDLV